MDPLTIAAIGGAATGGVFDLVGGLIQGAQAKAAREDAEDFIKNHVMGRRYQYAVEDLRKAGLNPILANVSPASGSDPGLAAVPQNIMSGMASGARDLGKYAREVKPVLEREAKVADQGIAQSKATEQRERSQADMNVQLGEKAAQDKLTAAANERYLEQMATTSAKQLSLLEDRQAVELERTRAETNAIKAGKLGSWLPDSLREKFNEFSGSSAKSLGGVMSREGLDPSP